MTFAWPCLLAKNCVDPATKYHGHMLLAHIIAKFAIHKRIVLQVFHSLLKAHAVEARQVVKQALEILTPAMPGRMEDGNVRIFTYLVGLKNAAILSYSYQHFSGSLIASATFSSNPQTQFKKFSKSASTSPTIYN